MPTYLLTWNPNRWDWIEGELSQMVESVQRDEDVIERWSCGRTRKIKAGDRVFLIRLGQKPRGIFASGVVTRSVFEGKHWDEELASVGKATNFVEFKFDMLNDPINGPIIQRELLKNDPQLSQMHWDTQSSGVSIPNDVSKRLESLWIDLNDQKNFTFAEEINYSIPLIEGAKKKIIVNAYERSQRAREDCIQFYGCKCIICGFDFKEVYGSIGDNFIHVHHITPLSEVNESYVVDPIRDLRPVCPNCHAIIHRHKKAFSIDQVKSFIEKNGINKINSIGGNKVVN